METHEDSCDSLPYIDDSPTEEETIPHQYNLKISENYRNKNRNIEITNRHPNATAEYLSPVAPLADESELNSEKFDKETQKQMKNYGNSGMKLVIKGWHSSISIQGLDNKSSITLKRKCEKHKKENREDDRMTKTNTDEIKPRRGRWKMLTKSLMLARSARFERRGIDERYPKYVLLKNEDEELSKVKENYPKMFVFNDKKQKGFKSEFNFKKSFKNKTEPIVPLEKILNPKEEQKPKGNNPIKQKQPLSEGCRGSNRNLTIKKRIVIERKKNQKPEDHIGNKSEEYVPQSFVSNAIQGIFEDTLKLLPQNMEVQQSDRILEAGTEMEFCSSVPPQYCQFSCHDPYCCLATPGQNPPQCVPVCPPPNHLCKNSDTGCGDPPGEPNPGHGDVNLENFSFGLLSSFFPRVVIMKTIQNEDVRADERREITPSGDYSSSKSEVKNSEFGKQEEAGKTFQGLQIPQKDLTLKSKIVQKMDQPELEDSFYGNVKESSSSDEELKTKTQESEATTEYLQYSEFFDSSGNEGGQTPITPPPRYGSKEIAIKSLPSVDNGDENSDNLTLTKIGYKMYDNLTKLSLNRDKETAKTPEMSGCGCNGNEMKKSPYNITLESSNSVVKVTVPEKELNFQIVNSQGADIQIGVTNSVKQSNRKEDMKMKKVKKEEEEEEKEKEKEREEREKMIVRKEELWHPDGGGRAVVLKNEGNREAAFQKLKVSLADNKDVVLSIEMNEIDKKEEKTKEKHTKEMKVGTDDFDLAGGDFSSSGGNQGNLSPRIGRLLKHLHNKLESDERDRKFLDEKINQKLLNHEVVFPGVFLVKHISPRNQVVRKPPEVPALEKVKRGKNEKVKQVREYYCEECLATMRIFEDENPSVKSMVDKFETIIQLESF